MAINVLFSLAWLFPRRFVGIESESVLVKDWIILQLGAGEGSESVALRP